MKATSSGELLYDYAVKILSLYQDSHSAIGNQEIKELTIGSIETVALYYLPDILDKFKKLYPAVHIRIIPSNERNIIQMIKEKTIDFGLILDYPYYLPEVETFF